VRDESTNSGGALVQVYSHTAIVLIFIGMAAPPAASSYSGCRWGVLAARSEMWGRKSDEHARLCE
jgi:hypothetical protein